MTDTEQFADRTPLYEENGYSRLREMLKYLSVKRKKLRTRVQVRGVLRVYDEEGFGSEP